MSFKKGSCPLLGLPTADTVLLDDFRPDPAVIDIPTLLCWLEGGVFVISRPLNTYRTHFKIQGHAAAFCDVELARPLHTS